MNLWLSEDQDEDSNHIKITQLVMVFSVVFIFFTIQICLMLDCCFGCKIINCCARK